MFSITRLPYSSRERFRRFSTGGFEIVKKIAPQVFNIIENEAPK